MTDAAAEDPLSSATATDSSDVRDSQNSCPTVYPPADAAPSQEADAKGASGTDADADAEVAQRLVALEDQTTRIVETTRQNACIVEMLGEAQGVAERYLSGAMSAAEAQQYLDNGAVAMTRAFMTRQDLRFVQTFAAMNDYIRTMARVLVRGMDTGALACAPQLALALMSPTVPYWTRLQWAYDNDMDRYRGAKDDARAVEKRYCAQHKPKAAVTKSSLLHQTGLHGIYDQTLNACADLGCFDALARWVQARRDTLDEQQLAALLRLLQVLHERTKSSFYTALVKPLVPLLVGRVVALEGRYDSVPARDRRKFKDTMAVVWRDTEAVAAYCCGSAEAADIMDRADFEVAVHDVNSGLLEARIRGLDALCEMVHRTTLSDNTIGSLFFPGTQKAEALDPLRKDLLARWLMDPVHNIMHQLLDFSREEAIRLNTTIIVFLLDNGLTTQLVEELWRQAAGQHQSLRLAIFAAIAELLPVLARHTPADIRTLYDLLSQMDMGTHDTASLTLISQLLVQEYSSQKLARLDDTQRTRLWRILFHFFGFERDSGLDAATNDSLENLGAKAAELLCRVLEAPGAHALYLPLIAGCCDLVEHSHAVVRCIRLTRFIISRVPKCDQQAFAKSLTRPDGILTRVLSELGVYVVTAHDNLAAINAKLSVPLSDRAVYETALVGTVPHREQLTERLEFVADVCTLGFGFVSSEVFAVLYDTVGTNALSAGEREDFFNWLGAKVVPNTLFTACKDMPKDSPQGKAIVELFHTTGSRLTCANVTPASFKLFWKLFLLAGMVTQRIVLEGTPMKPRWDTYDVRVYAKTPQIEGLEALWAFVLDCSDEAIGARAAECLNHLYSEKCPQDVSDEHMRRCIQTLQRFQENSAARMHRCLVLIMHMVVQAQNQYAQRKHEEMCRAKQQTQYSKTAVSPQQPTSAGTPAGNNVLKLRIVVENPEETRRKSAAQPQKKSFLGKMFSRDLSFEYRGQMKTEERRKTIPCPEVEVEGVTIELGATLSRLRRYLSLNLRRLVRQCGKMYNFGQTITVNDAVPPDCIHIYAGERELFHSEDNKQLGAFGLKGSSVLTIRVVPVEADGPLDALHIGQKNFSGDIAQFTEPAPLVPLPKEQEGIEHVHLFQRHAESLSSPFFMSGNSSELPTVRMLLSEESRNALTSIITDSRCINNEEWNAVGLLSWELIQHLPCPKSEVERWTNMKEPWTNIENVNDQFFALLCDLAAIDALLHVPDKNAAELNRKQLVKTGNAQKLLTFFRSGYLQQHYQQSIPAQIMSAFCLSILHATLFTEVSTKDKAKASWFVLLPEGNSFMKESDIEQLLNICRTVLSSDKQSLDKETKEALFEQTRDMDKNESMVVMYALDMIGGLLESMPETRNHFTEVIEAEPEWIPRLLVSTRSATRAAAADCIIHIQTSTLLPRIIEQVCSFIPHLDDANTASESYLALVKQYIAMRMLSSEQANRVCQLTLGTIKTHKTTESFRLMKADRLLGNLLDVLIILFGQYPCAVPGAQTHELDTTTKEIVDFFFHQCLLATPEEANRFMQQYRNSDNSANIPPRCKLSATRKKVLTVLEFIATQDANPAVFSYVASLVHRYIDKVDLSNDWAVVPPHDGKVNAVLGLHNLGATCYMNSIIQQLYHIKAFRNSILSMPEFPRNNTGEGTPQAIEWSTLFELQLLFARLNETASSFAETRGFARTVKINGELIRTCNQMDANEFYNSLFASLETSLSHVPGREKLLGTLFQGTTVTQVECQADTKHVSQRQETFYSVSVDVKNSGNLGRALSNFIAGENMTGDNQYVCSFCNKKVDAVRRTLFQTLPQVLVIHLKRFEFQMSTMSQIKLHDRCEFPMVLDMEPYMASPQKGAGEQSTSEEPSVPSTELSPYKYRLSGIVVHSGSANGGHYFSYHRHPSDPNRWLELNDTVVSDFDPRLIPENCFGSKEEPGAPQTVRSAYILFYERIEDSAAEQKQLASDPDASEGNDEDGAVQCADIQKIIVQENAEARMKGYLFAPDFTTFIWDLAQRWKKSVDESKLQALCDAGAMDTERQALFLFVRVMFDVLMHGNDRSMLPLWEHRLNGMVASSKRMAGGFLQLLTRNPHFMQHILVNSARDDAKIHLIHAIILAVKHVYDEEKDSMTACKEEEVDAEIKQLVRFMQEHSTTEVWCDSRLADSCMQGPAVPLFVRVAMDLFYPATSEPRRSQMLFVLFSELAKLGAAERHMLCDGLGFFTKATNLLRYLVPPLPETLNVVRKRDEEEKNEAEDEDEDDDDDDEEDDGDEKNVVPTSMFAELYGFKKTATTNAPAVSETRRAWSTLTQRSMVYLLEAVTTIVQNAVLPQTMLPPRVSLSSPAKASRAEPRDVALSQEQLDLLLESVFPEVIKQDTGLYCVKAVVVRFCSASRNAVSVLTKMFGRAIREKGLEAPHFRRYADVVLCVLNLKDSETEDRAREYMTFHLNTIAEEAVGRGTYASTVLRPLLETLCMIVNESSSARTAYKLLAKEFFTERVLQLGLFQPSYM